MAKGKAGSNAKTLPVAKALTQLTGAAGEAMAQVHLLARGWIAGNINASVRNNAGFDLTATKAGRTITIAVKGIGRGQHNIQWSGPKGETTTLQTLFRGETQPDFVVVIWFIGTSANPTLHRAFVIPTAVVDHDVLEAHRHWFTFPRKDGAARKQSGHIAIGLMGKDSTTNITNNFAEKWAVYEDAWRSLEQPGDGVTL
jgi:hypothetical protein